MRQIIIKIINKKASTGFTLAEVLITLLIIGIVASIVIPALISDTQDAELHTAWRKTYSDISQATKMLAIDNGGNLKGLSNATNLRDKYSKFISFVKQCDIDESSNCWHSNSNNVKELSGKIHATWQNAPGAIMANGSFLHFWYVNSDCNFQYNGKIPVCGWIDIDINGLKGPNTFGKDMYGIYIMANSTKPYGFQGDGYENTCIEGSTSTSNTGWGCGAKYLMQ